MKIVHCLNSLNVGGAESLVTDYAIYLKENNLDVKIVIFNKYKESILHDELISNNIQPIYLLNDNHRKGIGYIYDKISLILNWIKFLNENQIDVIHAHIKTSNYLIFAKSKKTKLFYTYHSNIERYVKYLGKTWLYILRFLIVKKDLKTFVLNSKMLNDAKKIVSRKNVYYMPNSVDFEKIKNRKIDRCKLKQSIGINDEFIIIHVGRINPVKNHQKLLEVFYEIKKIKKNSKLVIVGTGEKDYVFLLEERIKELNLENDVIFLGLREDIPDLLSISDCLIFPSFQEGFPMVVLEAQIMNTKCVVSKAVPKELICNENCLSLDIDDESSLWANYALGNYRNTSVKNINEFNMDVVMKRILEFYGA